MYSPNSNKDLKTLDRKIDINNIFTQNRLSLDDAVEGGQSLTLGGEYSLKSKENGNDIIKAGLATVLRDDEEKNLPTKSTLNNKGSDFIGSLIFEPNKNSDVFCGLLPSLWISKTFIDFSLQAISSSLPITCPGSPDKSFNSAWRILYLAPLKKK